MEPNGATVNAVDPDDVVVVVYPVFGRNLVRIDISNVRHRPHANLTGLRMREILDQIDAWHDQGKSVAVATVVKVWGSAPRPLGSKMVVSSEGEMAGSVSGGCVEGAVAAEAASVLESGAPKLVHFGVSDDRAWAVGLSCGGRIEVFIESLDRSS